MRIDALRWWARQDSNENQRFSYLNYLCSFLRINTNNYTNTPIVPPAWARRALQIRLQRPPLAPVIRDRQAARINVKLRHFSGMWLFDI